jgi:Ca2+/Na+ antiporter
MTNDEAHLFSSLIRISGFVILVSHRFPPKLDIPLLSPDTRFPMLAAVGSSTPDIVFLFAVAGLVLYIASRAAVDALTAANDPSPGKLAVGHWIPIAWTALLATAAGRPEVGVGVALATSVAAVGMVMGVLTCISSDPDAGPRERPQAWPFVVPAALLVLIAGFSGGLTWWHALMMLALGACVLSVWLARTTPTTATPTTTTPTYATTSDVPLAAFDGPNTPPSPAQTTKIPPTNRGWRAAQLLLAIAVAAAGGWLAYRATIVADARTRIATSGLIAACVISPLLVLPMLGTGAIAAHHGRLSSASAGIVGVVLLNLCALLPLVILTHYARQVVLDWDKIQPVLDSAATTEPAETIYKLRAMPFPLAVWRIDTVLLLVFGLLLIPVSLGRVTLRKAEGLALTIIYAVYLLISTALAIRL